MIQKEFVNILCCPKRLCRGDLKTLNETELECVSCKTQYPVKNDIPILFPNADFSPDIHKRHWDLEGNAKSYAQKYDTYLKKQGSPWGLYTHLSELQAIKKLTAGISLEGKTILDCGCGNGRLLSEYPEAGTKIGIDTSLHLLEATKEREPNFWLVCGQLEDMPFKDAVADFSVSIRVFQHLRAPEHAFAEMTRVTRPSGFVALENYNKFNLKELYKRFRMLPAINKIKPWGLSYDAYHSYRDIEKWCDANFVQPLKYAGAGWGAHFYLFDLIQFRRFAPTWIQKPVYGLSLWLDKVLGGAPFFRKTMEKICFIGSIQGKKPGGRWENLKHRLDAKFKKRRLKELQAFLENRNYCFAGNDLHHLKLSISWLKEAQDQTADGGVSRGYSFIKNSKTNNSGWQPSYPETTGYIIPSIIRAAKATQDNDLLRRARLMADWELAIMLPSGAVMGGNVGEKSLPAVFDTGAVIRGLLAIHEETNDAKYLNAATKAAEWIANQEHQNEGRWIKNNATSVDQEHTTYNIYASVPVLTLGKKINNSQFIDLGKRAGEYVTKMQNENGWIAGADFQKKTDALLHTIAYTIDGLWDTGVLLQNTSFANAAVRALDGVLSAMDSSGRIPGRLAPSWQGSVNWACLTGIAQIGVTCMKVFKARNDKKYLEAATKAKNFLKTCQNNIPGPHAPLGSLWGSWPISGGYGQFTALNWPVKYFADLLMDSIESGS